MIKCTGCSLLFAYPLSQHKQDCSVADQSGQVGPPDGIKHRSRCPLQQASIRLLPAWKARRAMNQNDQSGQIRRTEPDQQEPVLVSACLLGVHCRYDGSSNPATELIDKLGSGQLIPVCPEQLGGMGTPRPPAALRGGSGEEVLEGRAQVVTEEGIDVTEQFLRGATQALRLAKLYGARRAILKERSPSCGLCQVRRDGRLQPGSGVAAALLRREGISLEPLDPPKRLAH